MTVRQALAELEALGDEGMRACNLKCGAGEKQFGVKLGDIRKVARMVRRDHALALALWKTGHVEARFLATLVVDVKRLSADEVDGMVRSLTWDRVADWLNAYLVKEHPEKEALRERAVAVGEKLGVYRDYPCSKGCVSPFAPIAIREMARRKG
jgi:3-methyladenine DNA glycosylase AlkD